MEPLVGVLGGRASSFAAAVIATINDRGEGVSAERVRVGAIRADEPTRYTVVLDRFSHELPSLRAWLKCAAQVGVAVVNDPFAWTADDKFFEASLAARLGLATPRTVVLPNQATLKGSVQGQALECLEQALDWDALIANVGMPCVLKDAHGNAWNDVFVCRSPEELRRYYELSGRRTMIVQEHIEWDRYVRCICVGREHVLPIRYVPHETDPAQRLYLPADEYLSAELAERIIGDTRVLVRALGYDLDTVEWAIRDGVPYVIDSMNPVPELDEEVLPSRCFQWAVNRVAEMAIAQVQRRRESPKASSQMAHTSTGRHAN